MPIVVFAEYFTGDRTRERTMERVQLVESIYKIPLRILFIVLAAVLN